MTKLFTEASVTATTLAGSALKTTLTNISQALKSLGAAEASRSTLTATAALTNAHAGFRQIDATAASIVFTLPASGTTGDDIVYEHRRIDNTANTVTYNRAGTDTIEGSATGITLAPYNTLKLMMPTGGTDWRIVSIGNAVAGAPLTNTTGGTGAAYTLTPAPYLISLVSGRRYRVKFNVVNTSACTLAVSGLTATALKVYDSTGGKIDPPAGALAANMLADIEYDGTHWLVLDPLPSDRQLQSITASVAVNALTISASALSLDFRSTTLGSGAVTTVSGTPANLVISSGSTLGTVSAVGSRIAVIAMNNAGTIELAAVNVAGGTSLDEGTLITTVAEGGAGAADSATVIYSATARTAVAFRVIGYVDSTQATAGTWATAPSTIQGAGGNAVTAMSSLGYGQTWQNLVGSRALSTTYYNTTGKPIMITVAVISTAVELISMSFTVNGVTVDVNAAFANGANYYYPLSTIVPAGASYRAASTKALTHWNELR